MSLLLNGAGTSAADPILTGLKFDFLIAASTMDVATITDVGVDTAAGFPVTNSVKSSLSPAATVLTAGTTGTYNDTTKNLTISSTTGLSANDYIYLSHASITAGVYQIASVVNSTDLSFVSNPFNGLGNKTSIVYQVGWRYTATGGTSPMTSSSGGQVHYLKADMADSAGNHAQTSDTTYVRDAPTGASYIAIAGGTYAGASINTQTPTLDLLSAWANNGGIATVKIVADSSARGPHFSWTTGGGTAEKAIATAESSGLTLQFIDGTTNYAALELRSLTGSANKVSVDISILADLTAPTLALSLHGI